jgi:hypothetical protein
VAEQNGEHTDETHLADPETLSRVSNALVGLNEEDEE